MLVLGMVSQSHFGSPSSLTCSLGSRPNYFPKLQAPNSLYTAVSRSRQQLLLNPGGMYGEFARVAIALALFLSAVSGWLESSVRGPNMSLRQPLNVQELWPHLAAKKTCASEAAGQVIREAWASDLINGGTVASECGNGCPRPPAWTIHRSVVKYNDGDAKLEGLYARPEGAGLPDKLPGVIIAHTAVGPQEDFVLWKLDAFARLGYAAFALDMFGTGHALWDRPQSLKARRLLTQDRALMQARAMAAVRTLGQMEEVDEERLAAVGYCFGGMAVLDIARMVPPDAAGDGDVKLKAVASLHGLLVPILPGTRAGETTALTSDHPPLSVPKVLVLHASADPFVPPEQVQAFESEFLQRGAGLEIVRYGGEAMHAFTRPEKNGQADRDSGLSYSKRADEDSWRRVVDLLREEFK